MLSDEQLKALFLETRTVLVVGLSPKPYRPSHGVAAALQARGLRIIPVNPIEALAGNTILGERVWPDIESGARYLREQGLTLDIVDVFRDSSAVPPIVDSAIAADARALWLQIGVVHEQAARQAQEAGLQVEMDRCLKVEWARLMD